MVTPAHVPTAESRALVRAYAEVQTEPVIAKRLGIGEKTLRKYYREELDAGFALANHDVAENLLSYARGKKGTEKAQVTAAIFWLKTRAGWRETINVNDVTDPSAGARERLASKLGAKLPPSGEEGGASLADPIGRA
jgi:hypothetical protein